MKKLKNLAKQECANWNNGNCLGCMMKHKNDALFMWIDVEKEGKPCSPDECDYLKNVVIPKDGKKK